MTLMIKKGLNVPLQGMPTELLPLFHKSFLISLNLDHFSDMKFSLLAEEGAFVKIGTPLLESKKNSGLNFVSPASGNILEIRRGEKRVIKDIIIQVSEKEEHEEHGGLSILSSRMEILSYLMRTGIFAHINCRPFGRCANPRQIPRSIFIKAIESLPFVPSPEMQISGEEESFHIGLKVLQKLTAGKVFLVCREKSTIQGIHGIETCHISGPHPSGNASVHIHHFAPIKNIDDIVWTLTALDVVVLGTMIKNGRYYTTRILGVGGEGVAQEKRGFIKSRLGVPVKDFLDSENCRWISGDPLTGQEVGVNDFLKFSHTCLSSLKENEEREPLHFLGFGFNKYSMHKAYASGHVKPPPKGYSFTTNQHGEERAFVDGSVYDKVMPMRIPTMPLIRAILAEDFELAEQLGLLEVVPEDFALPAFICPSKIEMMDIVKKGIKKFSQEME